MAGILRSATVALALLTVPAGCGDGPPRPAGVPSVAPVDEPPAPLAGPSGWDDPSAPPAELPPPTGPAPPAELPPPTGPTPPVPGAGSAPRGLGTGADAGRGVTVTAFAYRQPVATAVPPPAGRRGYEWGAADVRACLAGTAPDEVTVSNSPWRLTYESDTRATPSTRVHLRFPRPRYAFGQQRLAPGGCIRGWITFPVPTDERPTLIEYGPEDGGSHPVWLVT